jgi:hypothetical protein
MTFNVWIAASENGSVMFDAPPSVSDILNACDDLERPIEVYELEAQEISRYNLFTVKDEFPEVDSDG